ncbi:SRPBCC domain-containing protein [Pyxidicoccus parkwayensis]|uniref:SRPBCC domain-containing protein n=1 Tax=Pyxidicoccus parkwayensis TaxID=2813578 RepID=A0ABX7P2U3_9BACT|nr:SRPBCC domain-containing protein [Pyxidicoccus parkwaysis]QSQ24787.1 SRPBCC domain-containing protein [Pyxidicoccus parkwaysis]
MSELTLDVWIARGPDAVFESFTDPFRLRRWYGAPPGGHRTGATGDVASGEPFRVNLIDASGEPFTQRGQILAVAPGEGLELEMAWDGGGLGAEATRASIALRPVDGGTRVEVRQGPFSSAESLEAHRRWWGTCLGRLVRVAAGDAVPCFEEFWEESRGFIGPLGVAAYTVLAGLRETGASAETVTQVEELLYTHLPRLTPETAEVLSAVLRSRVKEPAP